MTTDIVERLRLHPSSNGGPGWLQMIRERAEAADTIDRLRAEVEALRLPVEPPPGLLMSMAIRFDHALGMPGYYDQIPIGLTHQQHLESTLRSMRQLYEEVAGHGFYRPEREAEYAALKEHTNG